MSQHSSILWYCIVCWTLVVVSREAVECHPDEKWIYVEPKYGGEDPREKTPAERVDAVLRIKENYCKLEFFNEMTIAAALASSVLQDGTKYKAVMEQQVRMFADCREEFEREARASIAKLDFGEAKRMRALRRSFESVTHRDCCVPPADQWPQEFWEKDDEQATLEASRKNLSSSKRPASTASTSAADAAAFPPKQSERLKRDKFRAKFERTIKSLCRAVNTKLEPAIEIFRDRLNKRGWLVHVDQTIIYWAENSRLCQLVLWSEADTVEAYHSLKKYYKTHSGWRV